MIYRCTYCWKTLHKWLRPHKWLTDAFREATRLNLTFLERWMTFVGHQGPLGFCVSEWIKAEVYRTKVNARQDLSRYKNCCPRSETVFIAPSVVWFLIKEINVKVVKKWTDIATKVSLKLSPKLRIVIKERYAYFYRVVKGATQLAVSSENSI